MPMCQTRTCLSLRHDIVPSARLLRPARNPRLSRAIAFVLRQCTANEHFGDPVIVHVGRASGPTGLH
jgi:hypothetical protein